MAQNTVLPLCKYTMKKDKGFPRAHKHLQTHTAHRGERQRSKMLFTSTAATNIFFHQFNKYLTPRPWSCQGGRENLILCIYKAAVPTFWAPGTGFMNTIFPRTRSWGDSLRMIQVLHLLCTLILLLLHQLCLRSPGIRSWR